MCLTFHNSIFQDLGKIGDDKLMNIRFYIIKYTFKILYKLFESLRNKNYPKELPLGEEIHWNSYVASPAYNTVFSYVEQKKSLLAKEYNDFYKQKFAPYVFKNFAEERNTLLKGIYSNNIDIDAGVMGDLHISEAEVNIKGHIAQTSQPIEQRQWLSILLELKFFQFTKECVSKRTLPNVQRFVKEKAIMSDQSMRGLIESNDFRYFLKEGGY